MGAISIHASHRAHPEQVTLLRVERYTQKMKLLSISQAAILHQDSNGPGVVAAAVTFRQTARVCRFALMLALLVVSSSLQCLAAEIVLLRGRRADSAEEKVIIRNLAEFYGLTIETVDADSLPETDQWLAPLRKHEVLAVLASQDSLAGLDWRRIQASLRRSNGSSKPILVYGVRTGEDDSTLKMLSGGGFRSCVPLPSNFRPRVLHVENVAPLTRTLSGWELPIVASPTCDLRSEPSSMAQTVLSTRGDTSTNAAVLTRYQNKNGEIFVAPQTKPLDLSWVGNPRSLSKAFSSAAVFIFFLSHAAGDYGWHLDGHYANLTIDDAWLTEPYGHLEYRALLVEMEKHNFHTTVAFIPWNFDRSTRDVVPLFLGHPERFSICIHGNDHAHQEFGDYSINQLGVQIADMKQAVARMERFRSLTGIGYDRFMVFPHGVAPQKTFAELRTYGFLGTANAANYPSDATFPQDFTFLLRPFTTKYGNLLSFLRYPATEPIPYLDLAIQTFIGNPLLLYGHENLFEPGIGAFSGLAEDINHAQPDTKWASLGEIARHSHLIRQRLDGGFDVWMLSNEMDLMNPGDHDAVFHIQREEELSSAVRSLTIDDSRAAFEWSGKTGTISLVVPAHRTRKVRVEYENDMDLAHQDIRKSDLYSYALRRISDVRDLYLSRSSWGRVIEKKYYGFRLDAIELYLESNWFAGGAILGLVVIGLLVRRRRAGKKNVQRVITN